MPKLFSTDLPGESPWPMADYAGLWVAWRKVCGNAGGAGGDGIRVAVFERDAGQRIARLSSELAAGRYRPGPLRRIAVPKRDGGERVLAIPCVIDRIAQTRAAALIAPLVEPGFSHASFAYRPRRGVADAVRAVLRHRRDGYRWAAEGDVRRCFDEIPHEQLLGKLEVAVRDTRLVDLVALWLTAFAPGGIGMPQGSPLSPLLCNLHLDAVDDAIDGSGLRLVRYADDFVILAKTEARAQAGLEQMAAQLRMHGLELNPEKSRVVDSQRALHFLGHTIVRSLAFREVEDDSVLPAPTDAPPEELLAQWARTGEGEQDEEQHDASGPGEERVLARRTLHLVEPGALLSVRNRSFVAWGPEQADAAGVPRRQGRAIEHARRIDRIEIGPGAEADWSALALAAAQGVPLALVDGHGETAGWLTGPGDLRGRRVAAQARFLADPERCEALAMAIVRGRVRNQWLMLRRLNRTRRDPALAAAAVAVRRVALGLPMRAASDTAMGHEGNAARLFWPAYARALASGFEFDHEQWRRQRRPPPDPVNACLGYLAALLEREVRVAIERAGLHPGIGALHVARDDGDALIYDLMEGFRAAIPEGEGRPEPRCRIEVAARRALIQGHESWMAQPIESRRMGRRITWRALIEEEARALADLFLGNAERFKPYEIDY